MARPWKFYSLSFKILQAVIEKKMWQSSTLVISNHFFYPLSFLHNLCSIAALVLGEFVHKHSISSQAQLLQFGLLCSCLAGLRRCCVAGVQVQLVGAGCRSWLQVWFKQRSRSYAMRWWQLYQVKSLFHWATLWPFMWPPTPQGCWPQFALACSPLWTTWTFGTSLQGISVF